MRINMRSHRFVVGLALASVCGAVTFSATDAHALPNWLVNGSELKVNKRVFIVTHTTAKLAVPALNIEFQCAFASSTLVKSGLELIGGSGEARGAAEFFSCNAFQISNGALQKNCKPGDPITTATRIKLILHNSKNYILVSPEFGSSKITTITLPELCALAETSDITGSMVGECGSLSGGAFVGEDCNVARVAHLLRAASTELFSTDKLKFGENAATAGGFVSVELQSGESWAGHV